MQNAQPSCFGKHWDPANVECRGGNDPSYSHPKTGSNRREICRWYSACSSATNRAKVGQVQQNVPVAPPPAPPQPSFVPVSNMVRPPPVAPVAPPTPTLAIQPVPPAPVYAPQQQQVAYVGSVPYASPQFAGQPVLVPLNQPMPGAQVPSFLTVPEPMNPEVPMGVRLWRTVYRSMFKAAFVGAANFIDYNPLTPPAK